MLATQYCEISDAQQFHQILTTPLVIVHFKNMNDSYFKHIFYCSKRLKEKTQVNQLRQSIYRLPLQKSQFNIYTIELQ